MSRVKILTGEIDTLPIEGVKVRDNYLDFPDTFEIGEVEATLKALSNPPSIQVDIESYQPTQKDLDLAKSKTKSGDIENYGFFRFIASSTRMDLHRHRFTRKFLVGFRDQYKEGRTMLFQHKHDHGIGQTFDSRVVKADDGEYELEVKFFIHPEARLPTTMTVIDAINSGTYKRASVGFIAKMSKYIPASESEDKEGYFIYDETKSLNVLELSIVAMGANTDAKIKSTPSGVITFGEIEQDQKNLSMKDIELKSLGKTIQVPGEVFKTLQEVDQLNITLKGENEALKGTLKTYQDKEKEQREALVNEFVNKSLQLNPDLTDEAKEAIKKEAELLSAAPELIESKIKGLNEKLAKKKNPTKPGKKEREEDGDPYEGFV